MTSSQRAIWIRIEAWYRANVPPEFASFPGPAPDGDIQELETFLGQVLPLDLRESYQVHDGKEDIGFYENQSLVPIRDILRAIRAWRTRHLPLDAPKGWTRCDGVQHVLWNFKWIPITEDGSGDHFVVDLAPAEGGVVGQLFEWSHEEGPMRILAKSWGDFLSQFALALESGEFYFDQSSLGVYPTRLRATR